MLPVTPPPGLAHPPPTKAVVRRLTLESTAYNDSGTTYSGSQTRPGVVAVNVPGPIPMHSLIRVGNQVYSVEDRIGCCSQLDFYVPRYDDAVSWGRRRVSVEILQRGARPAPAPHAVAAKRPPAPRVAEANVALGPLQALGAFALGWLVRGVAQALGRKVDPMQLPRGPRRPYPVRSAGVRSGVGLTRRRARPVPVLSRRAG